MSLKQCKPDTHVDSLTLTRPVTAVHMVSLDLQLMPTCWYCRASCLAAACTSCLKASAAVGTTTLGASTRLGMRSCRQCKQLHCPLATDPRNVSLKAAAGAGASHRCLPVSERLKKQLDSTTAAAGTARLKQQPGLLQQITHLQLHIRLWRRLPSWVQRLLQLQLCADHGACLHPGTGAASCRGFLQRLGLYSFSLLALPECDRWQDKMTNGSQVIAYSSSILQQQV